MFSLFKFAVTVSAASFSWSGLSQLQDQQKFSLWSRNTTIKSQSPSYCCPQGRHWSGKHTRALLLADIRTSSRCDRRPTLSRTGPDAASEVWTAGRQRALWDVGQISTCSRGYSAVSPRLTLPYIIGSIRAPNGACFGAQPKGRAGFTRGREVVTCTVPPPRFFRLCGGRQTNRLIRVWRAPFSTSLFFSVAQW